MNYDKFDITVDAVRRPSRTWQAYDEYTLLDQPHNRHLVEHGKERAAFERTALKAALDRLAKSGIKSVNDVQYVFLVRWVFKTIMRTVDTVFAIERFRVEVDPYNRRAATLTMYFDRNVNGGVKSELRLAESEIGELINSAKDAAGNVTWHQEFAWRIVTSYARELVALYAQIPALPG